MSTPNSIVDVSEVNLIDLYIQNKVEWHELVYKLICGALVSILALRMNDLVSKATEEVLQKVGKIDVVQHKVYVSLVEFGLTFATALGMAVALKEAKKRIS